MNNHLVAFQAYFHKLFATHYAASLGLTILEQQLREAGCDPDKNLIIGSGEPERGPVHAIVPHALILNRRDDCLDTLAKGILCSTFAYWEAAVRPALARDAGIGVDAVRCDLMGDLRRIRHCILHNDSMIDKEGPHMKVFTWDLPSGEQLIVSDEKLQDFARHMYNIEVSIITAEAGSTAS